MKTWTFSKIKATNCRTQEPYIAGRNYRVSGELTNTDIVLNQTFWLGTFPGLDEPQLDYIADKLEEFFGVNF